MKKIFLFVFSIALFFSYAACDAQTMVEISKPKVQLKDNTITIFYDILNSNQTDKFKISLEIKDSSGDLISANSLKGDIGENISGGSGKEIRWDLTYDSIYKDTRLSFKVRAEVMGSEKAKEVIVQQDDNTDMGNENLINKSNINRSNVVLSSLLFPGLGMSRLNKGEPHWIRGATAYSCIATSLVFYGIANKNFSNYQQSTDLQEREDYFNTANNQITISNTFLLSALGIWVVDFVWTMAGTKDLKKGISNNWTDNFSIEPAFHNEVITPTLAFKYNF